MKPKVAIILKYTNRILFLVSILFLAWYFKENYFHLNIDTLKINKLSLIISFLCTFTAQYIQAFLWHNITNRTECSINFIDSIYLRLKNEILKYIPGKVSQVGSLIIDYNLNNAPTSKVAYCIFLENVFSLLASVLTSVFVLYFLIPSQWLLLIILIFGAILFAAFNKIIIKYLVKIYNKFKGTIALNQLGFKDYLKYILYYIVVWFLFGLGFFFLFKAVYPISFKLLLIVISSFSASSLIGFLVFFAPAGIGFREGSLFFFLKSYFPSSILLIPVLISRFQIVVCDLISFLVISLIRILVGKYK